MTASAGHLMIAAAPAVSTYVLPELLERFVAAHPRVEVSVRTGHSEDVVDLVLRDEVQVGLGRTIRHPDLELRPFHTEDLVLVCAPEHPFTKRASVAMADSNRATKTAVTVARGNRSPSQRALTRFRSGRATSNMIAMYVSVPAATQKP